MASRTISGQTAKAAIQTEIYKLINNNNSLLYRPSPESIYKKKYPSIEAAKFYCLYYALLEYKQRNLNTYVELPFNTALFSFPGIEKKVFISAEPVEKVSCPALNGDMVPGWFCVLITLFKNLQYI